MMFFNTQTPIANAYLQIARLFGEVKELPELYPLGNNSTPPKQTLLGSEYIVINPNASDLRLERRWGRQNFRVLIESILQKHPELKVVLIGSKGEKSYTESVIVDLKNDRLINLAGQTSIDELISTIQHAKLIITNDTGPMHIAFACNTPSICFFGPCSPTQYASANNSIVLYKNVYCSPCVHDFSIPPCNGDNVCMKLIEVAEVMKAVNYFFANSGDSRPVSSQHKVLYHHDKNVIGQVQRNILT